MCVLLWFINQNKLSDDTKRLETELSELTEKLNQTEATKSELVGQLDSLKSELELVKESRDQFELEKEENSIKVLILKFRKLTIEDSSLDSSLAQTRHRPEINWSEPPITKKHISSKNKNNPRGQYNQFQLTPSRLIIHSNIT